MKKRIYVLALLTSVVFSQTITASAANLEDIGAENALILEERNGAEENDAAWIEDSIAMEQKDDLMEEENEIIIENIEDVLLADETAGEESAETEQELSEAADTAWED